MIKHFSSHTRNIIYFDQVEWRLTFLGGYKYFAKSVFILYITKQINLDIIYIKYFSHRVFLEYKPHNKTYY